MRSGWPSAPDGHGRPPAPQQPYDPRDPHESHDSFGPYAEDARNPGGAGQRKVPFGPEISWPTGYYDLEYRDGGYRYPGQQPQAPTVQGEHPYASYGASGYSEPSGPAGADWGYGDPGYQDPGYQGPASEDAGFAAPGYSSPSRQGPGYQGPRQRNSYPEDAYPADVYPADAYPPDAYPPDGYRPDDYQSGGYQSGGYQRGPQGPGYPGGGYPTGDPRDTDGGWAGANFGPGTQELRDYEDFRRPDQRDPGHAYGEPRYDGPGHADSGYGAPGYGGSGYDEGAGYGDPGYDRPVYGAPGYEGQAYDGPRYDGPEYDAEYDQRGVDQRGVDEPGYGRLSYDDPRFDQPGPGGPGSDGRYDGSGYDGPGYGDPGYGGSGHHDQPVAPGYDDPRHDPRYSDSRRGDPRFEGERFDETRFDNPRVIGDDSRFDETRFDTPRFQDGGYDGPRDGMPSTAQARMLAAPTGLLARPDTGPQQWADERDVFNETMLDEFPALVTEQELPGTGQLDVGRFEEGEDEAPRGRRTGRRRGRSGDRRQWLALGGVVVVAAGAIVGVLKFAFPSHNGGPAHTMATPNQVGPYQRKVNLERQMKVDQLRGDVIQTSAGQASNVVSAVYQEGSTAPGSTAQIFMFIGGHLANAAPATSITSFTQKFAGARIVPAGAQGGEAACVEATENQGNVAMCIWFDNDSFGELVSPTMNPTTLATVMRTVRPSLELPASK